MRQRLMPLTGPGSAARRAWGDDGLTLIELITAMSVTAVFLAISTTAFLQLYSSANSTQAVSSAQSQVNTAFQRLDADVRYATEISTPGKVGSDWYVEYAGGVSGAPTCTELRLTAGGQLQRRTWPQGSSPPQTFPALATGAQAGAGGPFTVLAPGGSTNAQRLELSLTVPASTGRSVASRQIDVAFTAVNSASGGPKVTTCVSQGRG